MIRKVETPLALFALYYLTSLCVLSSENHGEYGTPCSGKTCQSNLTCINGQCECPFPNYQKYSVDKKDCISALHGPCQEAVDGVLMTFRCARHSKCVYKLGFYECLCTEGNEAGLYPVSEDKNLVVCYPSFGKSCGARGLDKCRPSNLVCRNGRCMCPELEELDQQSQTCVKLVGSYCSVSKSGECVNGAVCKEIGRLGSIGTCRCTGRFITTETRKCILGSNSTYPGKP